MQTPKFKEFEEIKAQAESHELSSELQKELNILLKHHSGNKRIIDMITLALKFADIAHQNDKREGGDLYITHPVFVAKTLNLLKADYEAICAGLLHDTLEDVKWVTKDMLTYLFNQSIADLVDGVTKVSEDGITKEEAKKRTVNKLVIFAFRDPRNILIKNADRIHNVLTMNDVKEPQRRVNKAEQTLSIYVPLARMMSEYQTKEFLEEKCFEIIQRDSDSDLHDLDTMKEEKRKLYDNNDAITEFLMKTTQVDRETKTNFFVEILKRDPKIKIVTSDIKEHFDYSFKSYAQIFERFQDMGLEESERSLTKIDDLFKFYINTTTVEECYRAKKVIESFIAEGDTSEFFGKPFYLKDYILKPAFNGYQALRARYNVKSINQKIQIEYRTFEMKKRAMNGLATCWNYDYDDPVNNMLTYLKSLPIYEDLEELCSRYIKDTEEGIKPQAQIEDELYNGLLERVDQKRIIVRLDDKEYNIYNGRAIGEFLQAKHPDYLVDGSLFIINGDIAPLDTSLKDGMVITRIVPEMEKPFQRSLYRKED